jgi:exopolyphosphatase/guanosine-5'-triphosphate,3'-diphosphate pyrophosphatase
MKVAALDLGSNTFLCLIVEVVNGTVVRVISDKAEVVRLGQDVAKTKMFHPKALERAKNCLENFSKEIRLNQVENILAMATSAARDVKNGQELFSICQNLSIPLEIIPGDKEADITYLGATSSEPQDGKKKLVIDVGGGSTEFIVGENSKVHFAKSLDIGCVRLTEKLISKYPVSNDEAKSIHQYIDDQIKQIESEISKYKIDQIIAVAGTPTSLAAAEIGIYEDSKVNGYKLSLDSLISWEEKLRQLTPEEIVSKYRFEKGRADVLLVGVIILLKTLQILNLREMTVSTKGVRYGVALEIEKRSRCF